MEGKLLLKLDDHQYQNVSHRFLEGLLNAQALCLQMVQTR